MARVRQPYEIEEVLQKDELEKREEEATNRKIKKIRKRRNRRRIAIVLLLVGIAFYFISDYSNVRVIEVKGNVFYTKKQIMDTSQVTYAMKSIMAPGFLIEKRLEEDPLIKDVSVSKTWDGVFRIKVEEENLVGYYEKDGKYYLLLQGEDDKEIKDSKSLSLAPYLVDLNKEQREQYAKALEEVETKNIRMISEVSHHETSYDKNMLKLIMQDGHIVYTSINGLKNVAYYREILKGLNTTHRCIVFAEESNAAYSEKCE